MKEEHLEKGLDEEFGTTGGGYQLIWHQFKENTTAHGIPHITNASGILKKSFWILITLGTLALLGLTLYSSFVKYFSYPVELKIGITTSLKLNFPAITVCNMNPIKSSLLSNVPSVQNIVSGKRRRKRDVSALEHLTQQSSYDDQKKKHNRQRRSTRPACSISWFEDGSMSWCYEFYDANSYNMSSAISQCPISGTGTTMVVLDTPAKIAYMKANYVAVRSYWLNAANDGNSGKKWFWGDGTVSVATDNWNAYKNGNGGQPAETGSCLYVDGQDSHKFVPASCFESLGLMCQTPFNSTESTTTTMTTDTDTTITTATVTTTTTTPLTEMPGTESTTTTMTTGTDTTITAATATTTTTPLTEMPESATVAAAIFSDIYTADEMPLTAEYVQAELLTELLADLPVANKSALGYQQHELLVDCQYNGRLCVQSDIASYFNPILGNCYTFNHNNERAAFKTGRRYGLTLVLNVAQDEYVKTAGDVAGVRLVSHHPDTMPFPEDEGLTLPPGLITSIGLRQTSINRQGGKYSDCIDDGFHDDTKDLFMETFNKSYGQASCRKTCCQERLTAVCGCADPSYPTSGRALGGRAYHACSTANRTEVDCRQNITNLFNSNLLKCHCPSPCSQVWFTSQVSSGEWPTDKQKNTTLESLRERIPGILDDPKDPDKYKRNLVKAEVYFEELNSETISEVPSYTETQLVSDIGGLLGLFIGFSVMTIFEFLQLLVEVMVFFVSSSCFRIHAPNPSLTKVAPKKSPVVTTRQVNGPTDKVQTNNVMKGGFSVCQEVKQNTNIAKSKLSIKLI